MYNVSLFRIVQRILLIQQIYPNKNEKNKFSELKNEDRHFGWAWYSFCVRPPPTYTHTVILSFLLRKRTQVQEALQQESMRMGLGSENCPSISSFSFPLPLPQGIILTGPGLTLGLEEGSQLAVMSSAAMEIGTEEPGVSQEQHHERKDSSCRQKPKLPLLCREKLCSLLCEGERLCMVVSQQYRSF
jgi:hypothetical protein